MVRGGDNVSGAGADMVLVGVGGVDRSAKVSKCNTERMCLLNKEEAQSCPFQVSIVQAGIVETAKNVP